MSKATCMQYWPLIGLSAPFVQRKGRTHTGNENTIANQIISGACDLPQGAGRCTRSRRCSGWFSGAARSGFSILCFRFLNLFAQPNRETVIPIAKIESIETLTTLMATVSTKTAHLQPWDAHTSKATIAFQQRAWKAVLQYCVHISSWIGATYLLLPLSMHCAPQNGDDSLHSTDMLTLPGM